jgi:hypothetical protein
VENHYFLWKLLPLFMPFCGYPKENDNGIKQKNKQTRNLKTCKDAHDQIIEVGLVEILSTQTACHFVTQS